MTGHFREMVNSVFGDLSTTLDVVFVLVAFFLLRYAPVPLSSGTLEWLFVAQATPSPAWLLAMFFHANLSHLIGNVGQLLLFGLVAERRLSTIEYLGFLGVTGVMTVVLQVQQYVLQGVEGGMAGASGASMAVMGFTVTHIGLHYFGRVDEPAIRTTRFATFLIGLIWAIIQTVSDFHPGWTLAPDASGIAHLSGLMLGTGYAAYKSMDI